MFRREGVPIHYSLVDNDDTIASHAHWRGGAVLSADADFLRYTPRDYSVFVDFKILKVRRQEALVYCCRISVCTRSCDRFLRPVRPPPPPPRSCANLAPASAQAARPPPPPPRGRGRAAAPAGPAAPPPPPPLAWRSSRARPPPPPPPPVSPRPGTRTRPPSARSPWSPASASCSSTRATCVACPLRLCASAATRTCCCGPCGRRCTTSSA
jgi:hypothetical protein